MYFCTPQISSTHFIVYLYYRDTSTVLDSIVFVWSMLNHSHTNTFRPLSNQHHHVQLCSHWCFTCCIQLARRLEKKTEHELFKCKLPLKSTVSLWITLPALGLYSALVPWLVYTFPKSFTFGESMIVSQGLTLLLGDTALQLFKLVCVPTFQGSTMHWFKDVLSLCSLVLLICLLIWMYFAVNLYSMWRLDEWYELNFTDSS